MKSKLSAALVAATCALAAPAHADIVGDTIHAYRLFPDAGTVLVDLGTFTVPGGGCSECAQNSGIAYNVTGTQITITLQGLSSFFVAASFNGFEFVDVSKNTGIVGITLDSATTAADVSGAPRLRPIAFSSTSKVKLGEWVLARYSICNSTLSPLPSPALACPA
jgi:hypothetical protein